jgi:hypothetical protein
MMKTSQRLPMECRCRSGWLNFLGCYGRLDRKPGYGADEHQRPQSERKKKRAVSRHFARKIRFNHMLLAGGRA